VKGDYMNKNEIVSTETFTLLGIIKEFDLLKSISEEDVFKIYTYENGNYGIDITEGNNQDYFVFKDHTEISNFIKCINYFYSQNITSITFHNYNEDTLVVENTKSEPHISIAIKQPGYGPDDFCTVKISKNSFNKIIKDMKSFVKFTKQ
jgi:hypothetical protein